MFAGVNGKTYTAQWKSSKFKIYPILSKVEIAQNSYEETLESGGVYTSIFTKITSGAKLSNKGC